MNTPLDMKSAALAGLFLISSAGPMSAADSEYKFIISGYPAEEICVYADSPATVLVTGTLSAKYDAEELEARYRTWADSLATALDSRKFYGLSIIFR